MGRKSSPRTYRYRPGTSHNAGSLSTFRQQMADFARAELLRELRAATHKSREKVAGEVGVTTKTLYSWENGGSIKWENAKKLAEFYGVDPEGLVSREMPMNGDGPVVAEGSQLDRIESKLDVILSALTESDEAETEPEETAPQDLPRLPGAGHALPPTDEGPEQTETKPKRTTKLDREQKQKRA